MRVEDESRERHVDPIAEAAARVGIGRDPFLVVESRGRRRRVDEGRCAPGELSAGIEGAAVHSDRVRRR